MQMKNNPEFDFDLFVIGGGSGGVRAARIAAGHGARVAIAEKQYWGGTCVNVGCVPKKLMTYAAGYAQQMDDAKGYGWNVGARSHDWEAFIAAKNKEIERLNGIYASMLEKSGARVLWGHAKLTGPQSVEVDGTEYTAAHIVIASGGTPSVPDKIPGAKEYGLTSDDVFFLKQRPQRVFVVGAGYIGVEFAGIFAGLGSDVTLVHRGSLILNDGFDDDLRHFLQAELIKQGIDFSFECQIERVEKTDTGVCVHRTNCAPVEADAIIFATGRKPNVEGLGLEAVGVEQGRGGLVHVNEDDQTNIPSIFALGDVTNRVELTPVALGEGHALADRLFGNKPRHIVYENIPTAVFSNPPLAMCGLTQAQADEKYPGQIDIYKSDFKPMRYTLAGRDERTLMKLIVHRETDKVIGLHMAGMDAPEIVQGFSVAIKAGATKADFDGTIGIHPTAAEEFVTMRTKG